MSMQVDYTTPLTRQERDYLLERGQYADIERADGMNGTESPELPEGDGTGMQLQGLMSGEVAAGELARLRARVAELESAQQSDPSEDSPEESYEDWKLDDLKAEIDVRNEGRPADQKIAKTGTKTELARRLELDDDANAGS